MIPISVPPGYGASSRGCGQYSTFEDDSVNTFLWVHLLLLYPALILRTYWQAVSSHYVNEIASRTNDIFTSLVVFGVAFTIFYETIVLVFTWIKTHGSQQVLWASKKQTSLLTILLRDGE